MPPHHVRYEEPAHYDHYDYGYPHPSAAPPPPPRSKYEAPEYETEYRVSSNLN